MVDFICTDFNFPKKYDISEVWATLPRIYSRSLVTVSPPILWTLHFISRRDEITNNQTNGQPGGRTFDPINIFHRRAFQARGITSLPIVGFEHTTFRLEDLRSWYFANRDPIVYILKWPLSLSPIYRYKFWTAIRSYEAVLVPHLSYFFLFYRSNEKVSRSNEKYISF